ncbi:hypothetical protein Egran_05511 [Elaphomyces granulatus]|uniref:Uncharacterized protein n=1 Tax=Elaphomyces granulatus TaxID=519963 RepID=A0A232LRD4_9EURO|nr:hypothetical protein Egran_05511 [Elaphomyces granulatus]
MSALVQKIMIAVEFAAVKPAILKKFFTPTVAVGKTIWPKPQTDMFNFGVRWEYGGTFTDFDGKQYHNYRIQPDVGKVHPAIQKWCDDHGVQKAIATMNVPAGTAPNPKVFEEAAKEALKRVTS